MDHFKVRVLYDTYIRLVTSYQLATLSSTPVSARETNTSKPNEMDAGSEWRNTTNVLFTPTVAPSFSIANIFREECTNWVSFTLQRALTQCYK